MDIRDLLNKGFWGRYYTERDKIMNENNLQNSDTEIVTTEEIKTILNDFRIGKKPLAKLLGWGETTIIRYIEGDIPTAEYSNKLKTIVREPAYYYELLLENKNNLTKVAFRKSLQAVLEKMTEKKIELISQYIIYNSHGELSPTYIQWLLYYVQAFSLALYDKELFEEDYHVNAENAPFIRIYNSMKKHGVNSFEISPYRLKEEERKLIDKVIDTFCWYGPKTLKVITSFERTNFKISRDKEGRRIISKDAIKKYFKDILGQYEIYSMCEINKYPDSKFKELRGFI
ncbi:MAG: type II toxin-antitoxin system antitoxin SocA domain-containing protein [Anaerocolumna sp.]